MNKKIKKLRHEQKKEVKKVKTTIDWLQIDKVHENYVELAKGKKNEILCGIKLDPHSLFLDSKSDQTHRIHLLRSALNRLNFDIWHGFVFNPVNLDSHLVLLARQMIIETDDVIKEMLEDDMDKARGFIQDYRELEFFMMIKGKPGNKFDDRFHQLQVAIQNADLSTKTLNHLDFDNFIAYQFENQLINDFYFSRGIFDENYLENIKEEMEEENDE